MKKIVICWLTFLFLLSFFASAATITVTSCSQQDVQAAVNAAQDGDVVRLDCASGVWPSLVTISGKGITIQGNGMDNTFIDGSLLIALDCDVNSLVRVTGIHFNIVNGQVGLYNSIIRFQECSSVACSPMRGKCETPDKLRIDNNKFTFGDVATIAIFSIGDTNYPIGGHVYGLIDNNVFVATNPYLTAIRTTFNHKWKGESNLGTWKMLYLEDNVFDYSALSAGSQKCATDFMTGSNVVTRFNTFLNCRPCDHGADTVYGSNQEFEIYGNTIISMNGDIFDGLNVRGGTGLMYNNAFKTSGGTWSGNRPTLRYYRADFSGPCGTHTCLYGRCDGARPPDSTWNSDNNDQPGSGHGWKCLQQPGVNWDANAQRWVTQPIYHWNNTMDGSPLITTTVVWGAGTILVENRDYYTYTTSFDGTAGVGMGLLSSRPATCTLGVAYWGSDTKALYKCSSPNTWEIYYTPYTYPHPLRSAGSSPPPLVPGDIDGNGVVDSTDLFIVVSDFGKASGFNNAKSDTNADGIIDIFDVVYVASRMG